MLNSKMHFRAVEMFAFKIFRKVVGAFILLVLVVPTFVVIKTYYAAHNQTIAHADVADVADVIVVLGTAQFNGVPTQALEARLIEAKRVFDLGEAPAIITVGAGAPGDRTTEAASSKAWLLAHGIKKSAVMAIEKGRDTFVSTQSYIAEMKRRNIHSVLIVTDPYHCFRATTIANDMGAKSYCSPVRTGPNSLGKVSFHYLIRETGAYLAYVTLGRRGIHVSDHLGQ